MISELGDQIVFFTQQAGAGTSPGTSSLETTSQLQSSVGSDKQEDSPMTNLNSCLESSRLSVEETTTTSTSTAVASSCEAMMWEGWSSHPSSSTGDEASTSNITLLPELTTTTSFTSRFHHQSDMLCNMLSSFHPLTVHPQASDDNAGFLHLEPTDSEAAVSLSETSKSLTYLSGIPCPLPKRDDQWKPSPWQGPDSREFTKWDTTPWPGTTTIQLFHDEDDSTHMTRDITSYGQAHQTSKKLELFSSFGNLADRHSEMNSVLANQNPSSIPPTAWIATSTPESYTVSESPSTRSQQLLNFVRTAQDHHRSVTIESSPQAANLGAYLGACLGSPRKRGGEESNGPAPKRPHGVDDHTGALLWRNRHSAGLRRVVDPVVDPVGDSACRSGGIYSMSAGGPSSNSSAASQAMELFAIGPALNTNGKPRARRGSATDPQSVYARHRREKINERLKTLQHLVPNGAKVDIVTMLDEAVHYVQFLQLQVKLLKSDKYWIHATPNTYKGIDLTNQPTQMQGLGSSA